MAKSELRKHYFLEHYVVIAPARDQRPEVFYPRAKAHKVEDPKCPFDNNNEKIIWQHPKGKEPRVKVIGNIYPAFTTDNPDAYGRQELVIDTMNHDEEFSDLSTEHIVEIFQAYRDRLTVLAKMDGIRYVLAFKNDGPLAGASVAHAHSQIFALPIVPPQIAADSDALNHYWEYHDSCAYCDIIKWEITQKVRIIAQDKHFIAIAPYASNHGFEAWVLPRRHMSKFAELHVGELESLAVIMKKLTARLDASMISFNFFLQESLDVQDHHFILKLAPRTFEHAGAELGTGIIINPVAPEFAALWYNGKA